MVTMDLEDKEGETEREQTGPVAGRRQEKGHRVDASLILKPTR